MCSSISISCMCLAIIDQYLSTCSRPRQQQLSNIKLAHRLSSIVIIFWIIFNIPFLIYYNQIVSFTTGKVSCTTTNIIFQQYINYVSAITLARILPVSIIILFGVLAYRNVHQLSHRALPLVRRELDKQLTIMIFVQIVVTFLAIVPYIIVYFLSKISIITQDPVTASQLQFVFSTTSSIYYIYFSVSVYI